MKAMSKSSSGGHIEADRGSLAYLSKCGVVLMKMDCLSFQVGGRSHEDGLPVYPS